MSASFDDAELETLDVQGLSVVLKKQQPPFTQIFAVRPTGYLRPWTSLAAGGCFGLKKTFSIGFRVVAARLRPRSQRSRPLR